MEKHHHENLILIKKYENRRLYCTNEKKYITLEDVESYVQKSKKIKVIEVTTDKDITAEVLTQILLEQGKAKHLPVELLEMMIKMNDLWIRQMWNPYFDNAFKMFNQMSSMTLTSLKPLFKNLLKKD
ncbi:MAG: hypothetical protein HUU56_04985 [Bdellovibrionaceae bacterium]|nr:hypothetical protein [Pseudobdellovibrionaceae bacterium]